MDASRLLLGEKTPGFTTGNQIQNELENFDPTRDMATATWGAHARSVVEYNPSTKMVTYHDPYAGGIDVTCTLDEFKASSPYLVVRKAKGTVQRPSTLGQDTKQTRIANNTPMQKSPKKVQNPVPQTDLQQPRTQTSMNTASPISTAKQKSAFIGLSETTIGRLNGREVKAKLTARSSSGIATVEINGKSYDILPNETLKISDEISIKCNSKGFVTAVNMPKTQTAPQLRQVNSGQQKANVLNSGLPTGFSDAGTTIKNGQVCRLAKNGNDTMIEIDGRWKLMI